MRLPLTAKSPSRPAAASKSQQQPTYDLTGILQNHRINLYLDEDRGSGPLHCALTPPERDRPQNGTGSIVNCRALYFLASVLRATVENGRASIVAVRKCIAV